MATTDLADLSEKFAAHSKARALTELTLTTAAYRSDPQAARALLETRLRGNSYLKATTPISSGDPGLDYLQPLQSSWGDLVRRQSFLGRMLGVRKVPPGVSMTVVDVGTVAGFVGEAKPRPVVRPVMTDTALLPNVIAGIVCYTNEALRAAPSIAPLVERDLSRAVAVAEDKALLDGAPAVAAERPASILHGKSPLGTGATATIVADLGKLLAAVRDGDAAWPYFLASPAGARHVMGIVGTGGAPTFPDVTASTVNSGTLYGIPLLTSAGAPDDKLTLVDADALLVVDNDMELDSSRASALEMTATPTVSATNRVSLFQADMTAVRAQRFISWGLAWEDGAAFISLPVAA